MLQVLPQVPKAGFAGHLVDPGAIPIHLAGLEDRDSEDLGAGHFERVACDPRLAIQDAGLRTQAEDRPGIFPLAALAARRAPSLERAASRAAVGRFRFSWIRRMVSRVRRTMPGRTRRDGWSRRRCMAWLIRMAKAGMTLFPGRQILLEVFRVFLGRLALG